MSIDVQNRGETFSISWQAKEALWLKARFHAMLVALSLAVSLNAFAQDKPAVVIATANTSSSWVETGVQRVETAYGNLSFAEIAKHAKREEILSTLRRSDKIDFREWELTATQAEGKSLDRQIEATEKVLARIAGTPWE